MLTMSTQALPYLSCIFLTSLYAQSFRNYNDESPCSKCIQDEYDNMMGHNFYTAEEQLEERTQKTLELYNRHVKLQNLKDVLKVGFKFTGIKGPRGDIGEPGMPGEDGKDGVFYSVGMIGRPGFPGIPGYKGQRGHIGQPGPIGFPGFFGLSGPPGPYIPVFHKDNIPHLISKRSVETSKEDHFKLEKDFQAPKSTLDIPPCLRDGSLSGLMHLQKRIITELIKLNQHLDEKMVITKKTIEDLETIYRSSSNMVVGPPGVKGYPGHTGDSGFQGVSWFNGDTGWDGLPGATGHPGNIGIPGPYGLVGLQGQTGPLGLPGVPAYSRVFSITTQKPAFGIANCASMKERICIKCNEGYRMILSKTACQVIPIQPNYSQLCDPEKGVLKSLIDTIVSEANCL